MSLTAVAILVWMIFALRRRRRRLQVERDTAISASLAAAEFNRRPFDDDDEPRDNFGMHSHYTPADAEMGQRSGPGLTWNETRIDPFPLYASVSHDAHGPTQGAYVAAPMSSPTEQLSFAAYQSHHPNNNEGSDESRHGRQISGDGYFSGSHEPLMATYATTSGTTPSPEPSNSNGNVPSVPLVNGITSRHSGSQSRSNSDLKNPNVIGQIRASSPQSEYSAESIDYDDRLDPGLRLRAIGNDGASVGASTSDLRDDKDYSRPVLAVRNITELMDNSSTYS